MNIQNISSIPQQKTFKGLWGFEIGQAAFMPAEVFRIDKIYPFSDDNTSIIKNELEEGRKNGVKNPKGENIPLSEKITICNSLPFSRKEFLDYKAKNGLTRKAANLTETELNIESFLDFSIKNRDNKGLSMYMNEYLTPLIQRFLNYAKNCLRRIRM